MEEGLNHYIKCKFNLDNVEAEKYSSLALAYIGDGVFDLIIRTIVLSRGNTKASKLHLKTSSIVKASTQSEMIEVIKDELNETEKSVYRRGRNAKSNTSAKNASIIEYRRATGFEALIGYLYLKDETERMFYLIQTALERIEEKI